VPERLGRWLCCLALLIGGPAGAEEPVGLLKVEIVGLENAEGSLYVEVYDSASSWLGDEPVLRRQLSIVEALSGAIVETEMALPVGRYAFSVYYDIDNDGELDTNFFGVPAEPIAVSNNAKDWYGAPGFEAAAFDLDLVPVLQRVFLREL